MKKASGLVFYSIQIEEEFCLQGFSFKMLLATFFHCRRLHRKIFGILLRSNVLNVPKSDISTCQCHMSNIRETLDCSGTRATNFKGISSKKLDNQFQFDSPKAGETGDG